MPSSKWVYGLPVGLLLFTSCRSAQAGILWAQDFNQIATGSNYADQTTLSNVAGTSDDVGLRTGGANSNFAVVDRGNGDRALQLLDNDSSQSTFPKANSANFSGTMSTGGTGNNFLTGGFTYTRLLSQTSNSTSPAFAFTATAPGSASGFDLELTVESNGHLFYYNGNTKTDSGFTLATNTEYAFQINADLSSSTQDKWSLKVTPVGSQTPSVNVANLNTMGANFSIVQFSFWGGLNQTAVNSSGFGQIDNINFVAQPVPEPAVAGVFIAAAGGALARRKRRNPTPSLN